MSQSVNKVIIIGTLGKDPEISNFPDGGMIVKLSVATSESWKDKTTGERKDKTEWHRVVITNENLCTIAKNYLTKGSLIYLEGQLQTRQWNNKEGVTVYSTEINVGKYNGTLKLLDSRQKSTPKENNSSYSSLSHSTSQQSQNISRSPTFYDDDGFDDKVPF